MIPRLCTVLVALVLAACASAPPRTDLADGATGTIRFATQTPTTGDFSSRNLNVPSAVIWGRADAAPSSLEPGSRRRPRPRIARCRRQHPGWRGELTRMGVAAFIVDSFTGRGITETATDQSRLATSAMIVDAYRALALLATHPAIHRDRIAVMGFSKGGTVALYSSYTRFQRDWGPPGLRFAAHLPFYPSCSIRLLDEEKVAAPIRIFHGAADDWTPIASCREYVEPAVRSGVDARIHALAGAHHGFDVPTLPGSLYLPRVQNGSRCGVREETPGVFVDAATGQPVSGREPCATLGATVGYPGARTSRASASPRTFRG